MYLRSSNSLHNILASVLCKKNEAILTKIPCFGAVLWLYRFEWNHMVWFSQSHITWSYANKMAAPIPSDMAPIKHGMVQPIAVAVLKTFAMMNKDGTLHPHANAGCHFCKL